MFRASIILTLTGATACSDAGLKLHNSEPQSFITSHLEGDEVSVGEVESFRGSVSDPDDVAENLTTTWFLDGEIICESSPPNSDGITVCDALIKPTSSELILEVLDPDHAAGSDKLELVAVDDQMQISEVVLTPATVYTDDTLSANVTLEGADTDSDSLVYTWFVDGQLVPVGEPTLDGTLYFDRDQEVYVQVVLTDASGQDTALDSNPVVVSNSPPTTPEVSITDGQLEGGSDCYSLYFDGTTENYVMISPMSGFPTGDITVEYWILSSDVDSQATAFDYHTGAYNRDNDFSLHNYNQFTLGHRGGWYAYEGDVSMTDGSWHHLTVTWDSSTGESLVYIDAVETASNTVNAGTSLAIDGALVLGQDQDSKGGSFEDYQAVLGYMTRVRMYDTVLTESEVEARSRGEDIDESHLVADWNFSEGSGTVLGDATGSGWDMEITGATWNSECPDALNRVEALHCVIDGESTDIDADAITYGFSWNVDGTPFSDASTTDEVGDTVSSEDYMVGEKWTCQVTPDDGTDEGVAAEAAVIVTE